MILFNKARNAFTLIELLVVIAIIGILSSVVLASLSGARESARDTKRVQDLRQIETALNMFYNDNGRFPTEDAPDYANRDGSGNYDGEICSSCTGNINTILKNYMSSVPEDPLNDGSHYYYYDGDHACGSYSDSIAVVFAKTMESGETNRDDLKCSNYGSESGLESASSPHIIILGDTYD